MSGTASLRVSLTYTILPANTVEALSPRDHSRIKATSSGYDHLWETPFELWPKHCTEKLS